MEFLTSHRVVGSHCNCNDTSENTSEEDKTNPLIGWGESVHGCIAEKYVPLTLSDVQGGPQVVNTA